MPQPFEWGVSSLMHHGESNSGDMTVVKTFTGGMLVAVIDALGHGDHAAYAANVAAAILQEYAHEHPASLIERCHEKMRTIRGAAISLASFNWHQGNMRWLGVGNVAGVLLSAHAGVEGPITSMLVRAGVVGDQLPELQPSVFPVPADTLLIMTTDGVRDDFTEILPAVASPQRLAERILERYARQDDDATALVFRFNGES